MDDGSNRRIEVLLSWRDTAAAGGRPMPSTEDLRKVGLAGYCFPPHVDRGALRRYRDPIEFLMGRADAGAQDPLAELAARDAGTGGGPGAAPAGPDEDLERLRTWHQTAFAAGKPGVGSLRDPDLVRIAGSSARTADAIRPMLPAPAAGLAAEIAAVLRGRSESDPDDDPAPDHDVDADGAPSANGSGLRTVPDPSATTAPDAEDADDDGPAGQEFARFEFEPAPREPVRVTIRQNGATTSLSWDEYPEDHPVVLYRVVTGDEFAPYAPEADTAVPVAVTRDTRATDVRPLTHAVRFVQVWCHVGRTDADAASAPPVLHAQHAFVAPVGDAELVEDEGRVLGQWTALPGTARVQVFRIPIELARPGPDLQFQIMAERKNLSGVDDTGAERGHRYLYLLSATAVVEGVELISTPAHHQIAVSALHEAVAGIDIGADADGEVVDLTWPAPPAGRVDVYRTREAPGTSAESMSEGALRVAGLDEGDRLRNPVWTSADGARQGMERVAWPRDWTRAWFTPVTVLEGRARIGGTVFRTRSAPIRDARIVERMHKQVVTFGWPHGAAAVWVFRGVANEDPVTVMSGRYEEITEAQYEAQGGMHLAEPLPNRGCSVHIVPVSWANGQPVLGEPVRLLYPGLSRMRYTVTTAARRGMNARGGQLTVRIFSEMELQYPPGFVLVHRADRLPLHLNDGFGVPLAPVSHPSVPPSVRIIPPQLTAASDMAWTGDLGNVQGYVRLFVDLAPDRLARVALLDPPLSELRLVPAARRRGIG